MHQPLVSIVTPSYNQGHFIRATIESVLSQTYQPIEYIIMDGGSTDATASIVKDYSSRVTWISERDHGQSHAINKGFRMAKGSIVSWLNSDDWILPGAVAHAVAGFAAQPEAGAVYGEGYVADRNGSITGRFPFTEPLNLWKLVHLSDYILQQTVYFRRAVIEDVGFLREDLHYVMDWDILIRIAKRYSVHYIPEYMGCLREYPESKSFSGGRERLREIASILREHTGLRYPPGYLVYGLHTYRSLWSESIRTRAPAPLRPFSNWLASSLSVMCGYWADRAERLSQGWRPDGWAGRVMKYMLPAGPSRKLALSGWIPKRQKMTIEANGVGVAEKVLEKGDFEWEVQIPRSSDSICLEFKTSRRFLAGVPYKLRSIGSERMIEPSRPGPHHRDQSSVLR